MTAGFSGRGNKNYVNTCKLQNSGMCLNFSRGRWDDPLALTIRSEGSGFKKITDKKKFPVQGLLRISNINTVFTVG
jgi:calcium-dependent protein kinase